MTEQNVIDVTDLCKSFDGKPAVVDVSLRVKRGEIFGFLGPNGSGKTTTIRMLCGLMTPDSGQGTCLGYDIIKQSSRIKRIVGYVPQAFSLYQDLTVAENLAFIARIYDEDNLEERVKKSMEEQGLTPYKNILSGRLSGGWKQRLSLAAALIHEPQLLLLDEPTAGVDPKARRDFWNYIAYLTTKGMTALVSTHYMDEAERCNRLAYIVYGRLMAEGSITDILKDSGLITWAASGPGLAALAEKMRQQKGISQVVAWGNELRVVVSNPEDIERIVASYPQFHWEQVATSLEEMFVHLVNVRDKENAT
jgi:ABC-2 type transport system ATP-binding protein